MRKQNSTIRTSKKRLSLLFAAALTLFCLNGMAQRVIEVPNNSDLSPVILGDTTETGDRIDANTIYELEMNGIYMVSKTLNINTALHIRAAAGGEGALPAILPQQADDGTWPGLINTKGDLILENLYLSNQNDIGGNPKWGGIRLAGEGTTATITGCQIEWDKAAIILLNADNTSLFMENCICSKTGNYRAFNGNGRLVDTRGKMVETVSIKNTTFYLMADRVVRNKGGVMKKFVFDHNTGIHMQGRHGCFQLGKVDDCTITNNLILNPMFGGGHPLTEEQTHPDKDNFYLIAMDEITDGQNLVISNNNFAFEQKVVDFFGTIDSLYKPTVLAPLVEQALGDAAGNAFIEEVVEFTNVPEVPMDFLSSIYLQPDLELHPDNFLDEVGIMFIDASYSCTFASHTAGIDGEPLGDLRWEACPAAIRENKITQQTAVYPNPFEGTTNITFAVSNASNVKISVVDINGRTVEVLANGTFSSGTHTLTWNSKNHTQGVYIVRFQSDDINEAQRIISK